MAKSSGLDSRLEFKVYDALTFEGTEKYNAGISCFLMEHLDEPQRLLKNMASNLETRGYAFVTTALTADDLGHVFEFRRESEIICMAEEAGFRVVSMTSASPPSHPDSRKFLPRSIGLILQKRKNDVW